MTRRFACAIAGLGLIAACDTGPISGTNDSGVNRLSLGMSMDDVGRTIGAHQFETVSSGDPAMVCRSYVYDEVIDAKFAHVTFVAGQVTTASDGHRVQC